MYVKKTPKILKTIKLNGFIAEKIQEGWMIKDAKHGDQKAMLQNESDAKAFMRKMSDKHPEFFKWTASRVAGLKYELARGFTISQIAKKWKVRKCVIASKVIAMQKTKKR